MILELSEYSGVSSAEIERRLASSLQSFSEEWREKVSDPHDEQAVIRFYDESKTEIFELANWHTSDLIHGRAMVCVDIAAARGAKTVLDFGSGIGSDALVFAKAGMKVTLADVSAPLLAFARWRCHQHRYDVEAVDLKTGTLPDRAYDAVLCFDVLEHIRRPRRTLQRIHHSMKSRALLFLHAPFGEDPDRPMHLVHGDPITARMRTLGFSWRGDLQESFPDWLWAPRVYEQLDVTAIDRVGYYIHDVWMPGPATKRVAGLYRYLFR